jgi:hypothetical protein
LVALRTRVPSCIAAGVIDVENGGLQERSCRDARAEQLLDEAARVVHALRCYRPRRSVGIGEHRAAWCAAWRAITSWGYV